MGILFEAKGEEEEDDDEERVTLLDEVGLWVWVEVGAEVAAEEDRGS